MHSNIKTKLTTNNNFNISTIYSNSGGYISLNKNLFSELTNNKFTKLILKEATKGTPLIKIGDGNPKVMILSGIHGNELPPQAASIELYNQLLNTQINGTIYLIPFAAPESTMYNVRNFKSKDLNRTSNTKDTIGDTILKTAKKLNIKAIGDFHSSSINSNPGVEGVFSTMSPEPESHIIASFIAQNTGCKDLNYKKAGIIFQGALEDESNLRGIPAVTCEVVSTFKTISPGSVEASLNQMRSFLKYFKIL